MKKFSIFLNKGRGKFASLHKLTGDDLYNYVFLNWGHHARASSADGDQAVLSFLEDEELMWEIAKYLLYPLLGLPQDIGLHIASHFGLERSVRVLLDTGACIQAKRKAEWKPCVRSDAGIVEYMVDALYHHREQLDKHNLVGLTPLLRAAENGHSKVVELLKNHGADVDARTLEGETALSRAAGRGDSKMVSQLLELGADVNGRSEACLESTETSRLITPNGSPEASSPPGIPPLVVAADRNHIAVVRLLLDHGANPEVQAVRDGTALNAAPRAGHEDIVRLLLEHGAAVESTNKWGITPILAASTPVMGSWTHDFAVRRLSIVRLLADHGANLEAKSASGCTPLTTAAHNNPCEAIARLLLEKGADVEARDNKGSTPLHIAAFCANKSMIQLFIDNGADIETKNDKGNTPLYAASRLPACSTIVQLLIDKGASTETRNKEQKWEYSPVNCR
jgi:ankyrin repeat protein